MNIALAYHAGDRDQAVRLMQWIAELGGLGNHQLYTIAAFDCEPIYDILPCIHVPDSEKLTGDWNSTEPARSAAAPNSMIRTFAWKFYLEKLGPWLFLEPDAVPLKPRWADILETEYYHGQMPFMGAKVDIHNVPEHLTGNMVASDQAVALAPTLVMRTNWTSGGRDYELAFDVAAAKEILAQAHLTNLIQHSFRHKGFRTKAEMEAFISKDAVLFHSSKNGSVIHFLRGGEDFPEPEPESENVATELIGGVSNILAEAQGQPIDHPVATSTAILTETFQTLVEPNIRVDTRASLTRDAVGILSQLCDTPSRKGAVQRELKRQKIVR